MHCKRPVMLCLGRHQLQLQRRKMHDWNTLNHYDRVYNDNKTNNHNHRFNNHLIKHNVNCNSKVLLSQGLTSMLIFLLLQRCLPEH